MTLPVTSLYAGFMGIGFLVLTARVILYRRGHRVAIG